jgi:hypothetical protein
MVVPADKLILDTFLLTMTINNKSSKGNLNYLDGDIVVKT